MSKRKLQIGVFGNAGQEEYPGQIPNQKEIYSLAYELGKVIAGAGSILVTGGKGGIMTEAARGAKDVGGITVGIISGDKRNQANAFTDIEVVSGTYTGGCEYLLPLMCDGSIAIGGGAGTLQEITVSYRNRRPVIVIDSVAGWSKKLGNSFLDERKLLRIESAKTPQEALEKLLTKIQNARLQ